MKSNRICFCFCLQSLTHCQHSHWSNHVENKSCFFQFWHLHIFMRCCKSTIGYFFPANIETIISNRFIEFWLASEPGVSDMYHVSQIYYTLQYSSFKSLSFLCSPLPINMQQDFQTFLTTSLVFAWCSLFSDMQRKHQGVLRYCEYRK